MENLKKMTTEQLKAQINEITNSCDDKLHLELFLRLMRTLEKNK